MTRRAAVGVALLVALLVGVAYQPDVGTAADLDSADLTDHVVGTNHAKPLPRVVTVTDVVRTPATALLTLVLLAAAVSVAGWSVGAREDDGRCRSVLRSLVRSRRGPPALVLG